MDNNLLMGIVERPPKTWVRVADRLQTLILGRKLQPGTKLPPERVLCEEFGVSRTVLREAIKHLSAQGLVEEITGRGTFVSKPNLEAVKKSLQICLGWHAQAVLENLVELRRLIEVEIAELASIHATREDIKNLQQNVSHMERSADGKTERFVRLDLEFHSLLARATHNELFVMLFDAISSALVGTWEEIHQDLVERRRGVRHHKKILAAIEQRRPDEARRAARQNIESYKRDLAAQVKQSISSNALAIDSPRQSDAGAGKQVARARRTGTA
jgi:GntR family transcriptional regulator, transcriptional repressor for pyruvate dehydrogenase complex